jgi:hypothetical protein
VHRIERATMHFPRELRTTAVYPNNGQQQLQLPPRERTEQSQYLNACTPPIFTHAKIISPRRAARERCRGLVVRAPSPCGHVDPNIFAPRTGGEVREFPLQKLNSFRHLLMLQSQGIGNRGSESWTGRLFCPHPVCYVLCHAASHGPVRNRKRSFILYQCGRGGLRTQLGWRSS